MEITYTTFMKLNGWVAYKIGFEGKDLGRIWGNEGKDSWFWTDMEGNKGEAENFSQALEEIVYVAANYNLNDFG